MDEHTAKQENRQEKLLLWPFMLQLVPPAFLPFIVWWSFTPTNVLNSGPGGELLESIGLNGLGVMLFGALPIGVIGLLMRRKMHRLRGATSVLAILNIICGAVVLGLLALLFYRLVVDGVSV